MSIEELKNIEDPELLYNKSREAYINQLNQFSSWDEYRKWLYIDNKRDNTSYLPQQIMSIFQYKIIIHFFNKFPFFKQFNPFFENEYKEFLSKYNSTDLFYIYSKEEAIKVRVELFNINKDELYYPRYMRAINTHSALHSLYMFLKEKDNEFYKGKQFCIYMQPLLTHPGDREYALYYASLFKYPIVILRREASLAWLLEVNGVPTIFRRYCTIKFKTETYDLFMKRFFYSWKYTMTKDELLEYAKKNGLFECTRLKSAKRDELVKCIENNIKRSLKRRTLFEGAKVIEPPDKNDNINDETKYLIYDWDSFNREWISTNTYSNIVPEYIYSKDKGTWIKTGNTITANNIISLIGLNKFQSVNRKESNPNISLHAISSGNFLIYENHSIYNDTFDDMMNAIMNLSKKLEDTTGERLKTNPYEKEYGVPQETGSETRYGCLFCPFKPKTYYENLKEKTPLYYWYCRLIELFGSAKTLMEKGKEYRLYPKEEELNILTRINST